MSLPFNGKLPLLVAKRALAIVRTYRQFSEMSMKDTYRDLAFKAKMELKLNGYIERVNTNILSLGKVHYLP